MSAKDKLRFTAKKSPQMFDHIAKKYDLLNRVMTWGLDRSWRKAMVKLMPPTVSQWLDAATGTGDQILFALKQKVSASKIIGIDLSQHMLSIAVKKLGSYKNVSFKKASLSKIPLKANSCDLISCSFGIRNVDPFTEGLQEFFRVLKEGGTLLILESSCPPNPFFRAIHKFYMKQVIPKLARLLGSDPKAYSYLATTTSQFPSGAAFCHILTKIGFSDVKAIPMTFGSVTLYYAKKL